MLDIKQNITPLDEDGNRHGEWLIYHDSGRLWYRCNYVHGIRHGLYKAYYIDGELMYRGYWNMDRRIGYWYDDKKLFYLCLI